VELTDLLTSEGSLLWKVWVTLEVLGVCVWVRLALRNDDIRLIVSTLRRRAPERDVAYLPDVARAQRLGRAVHRVLGHWPSQSRCLLESLVLTRMLSRRRVDSSLVIGVAPGETFQAHAWVESEGVALLPPLASTFTPLVRI